MLVRFEDTKGKPVWINPVHVRMLRQKRDLTEIQTPGSSTFVKIRMPIDQVADMLNSAMPDSAYVPGLEATAAAAQQAGGAAAATALLG